MYFLLSGCLFYKYAFKISTIKFFLTIPSQQSKFAGSTGIKQMHFMFYSVVLYNIYIESLESILIFTFSDHLVQIRIFQCQQNILKSCYNNYLIKEMLTLICNVKKII